MIPLRAENPRKTFAAINVLLILANIAVFIYQVSLPPKAADQLVSRLGVVPARLSQVLEPNRPVPATRQPSPPTRGSGPAATRPVRTPRPLKPAPDAILFIVTLFTSMFLHGGVLHIAGNMLFLWVFGASVEDRMGHVPYLIFYLICGIGAGLAHTAANWGSTLPSIGASGAISGVMGAYIVWFPRSKILTLVPIIIFFFTVRLPAVLILGYWFVIQFLSGFVSLGEIDQTGVAWWAHVGGFLLGAFLAFAM